MTRNIIISGVLLALFGVVGAGLVAFVHQGTAERIFANIEAATLSSLHDILSHEAYDNDILADSILLSHELLGGRDLRAYRARRGGEPVAAVFTVIAPGGYGGPIHLLVGVNVFGELDGVRVVSHRETPGLGDDIEVGRSDWILGFEDLSLTDPPVNQWAVRRDGGVFDQFTGATITPRAVVTAVRDALIYFESHRDIVFAPLPETEPAGDATEATTLE
ncbi:MAG: electron transport complex subunit RsxG [Thioalkalivibrio sp.]